jgi:predicted transcriptional regulator of viral defense system
MRRGDRLDALLAVAARQAGHVTVHQARAAGCADSTLLGHVRAGRLIRVARAVYRFRAFPTDLRTEAVGAWLALGREHGSISHETALAFHGFRRCDRWPIHLILPRTARWRRSSPEVRIHTVQPWLLPTETETVTVCGARVTDPVRSIVDIAAAVPDRAVLYDYVWDAVLRGLARRVDLVQSAAKRGPRVGARIRRALANLPLRSVTLRRVLDRQLRDRG